MNRPRVLVVEDDALIAQNIGHRIQQLDYQLLDIIHSGEEAIRSAVEMRPDVVLIDIQLGDGMDGIEAAARIREQCNIPVVYLTAYVDETILQRAKITTPFGYIVKPFRDQDLHGSIEIALYRHEQEQKLRESEERYRNLFNRIPVGLYRTTPAGQFVDANPAMVQMMGYPDLEALLAVNVVDLYADPRDRERFQALVERQGSVRGFQVQSRHRDGTIFWTEINAQSIRDADGQVLYYEGSIANITARKQATEELHQALAVSQQREAEISALLQSARAILEEREFERAARVIFDACKHTTGATAGYVALLSPDGAENEVLFFDHGGLSCTVPPDLPMPIRGLRAEAYRRGEVVCDNNFGTSERMRYIPEGHVGLENVMFAPFVIDQQAVGLLGLANKPTGFTDDDARMARAFGKLTAIALRNSQTREALRREKEFAENLVETAQTIVLVLDTEGRIVRFNPYMAEVSGYRLEEVQGRDWFSTFLPQQDHEHIRELFSKAVGDIQTRGNVNSIITKDGREREIEWYDKTLKDADGNVVGLVAVGQDITERKQTQDALLELVQRLTAHINNSPLAVVEFDPQFRVIRWSEEAERVFGWTREEIVGKSIPEMHWVYHKDEELVQQELAALLNGERSRSLNVNRNYRKDGTVIHCEWYHSAIYDSAGKLVSILALALDVTERRQAEQALQESKNELQNLFDNMSNGFAYHEIVTDEDGVPIDYIFLEANSAFEQYTGLVRDHIIGKRVTEVIPGIENMSFDWIGIYGKVALTGESVRFEQYFEPQEHWYSIVAYSPIRGYFAVTFEDITGRKLASEALRESEERFRELFEQSNDAIFIYTLDGDILDVNNRACQILEYSHAQLLSMSVPDLHSENTLAQSREAIRTVQEKGTVYFESQFKRSDGVVIDVEISSSVVDIQKGLVQGIVRDITERKRAEEERERLLAQIQEQAQRVQQIIDTVPEGVLLLDAEGRVILANPIGEQDMVALADARVGDTLTHLGDRSLADLLTPPPKGLWHEVMMGNRNFQIIARPSEPQSEASGWVLAIRDVTHQREFERHAQQQDRLAAVGQLAAGIAHDFNNIIAVIALYARMLLRDPILPAGMVERLEIIDQQAWQASELIQQILDFSRHTELERNPIDLLTLLKEQVKLLERTLPENIEIGMVYNEGDYVVSADPTRIQQVIMNLATNARDAMPTGGRLSIGLQRIGIAPGELFFLAETGTDQVMADEWLQLTVSDTGSGIPPHVLPHIFDPFFTTKSPDQGTGLGLAQVHGIIRSHEGHIDVQTQEGEGTAFIIYLPVLATRPDTQAPKRERLVRGKGETILVVEDAKAMRRAVADGLQMLDYRVLEATNGREALALFEQYTDEIALVLSDVVMPEMGGRALFRALREQAPTVKVVLMTGHSIEKELGELQTQGLNGWLLKPPVIEQLAQTIARVLEEE